MIPSYTIETGTISSTVMQYARDLIGAWDSYVLYDCDDSGQDEEYALIVSQKYDSLQGVFKSPCTVYQFVNTPVTDSHGHPTNTYVMNTFQVNQDLSFPVNNSNMIVYSSVSGYPQLERSVENYENQAFVLFGFAVTVCIIHVVLQSVIRRFG